MPCREHDDHAGDEGAVPTSRSLVIPPPPPRSAKPMLSPPPHNLVARGDFAGHFEELIEEISSSEISFSDGTSSQDARRGPPAAPVHPPRPGVLLSRRRGDPVSSPEASRLADPVEPGSSDESVILIEPAPPISSVIIPKRTVADPVVCPSRTDWGGAVSARDDEGTVGTRTKHRKASRRDLDDGGANGPVPGASHARSVDRRAPPDGAGAQAEAGASPDGIAATNTRDGAESRDQEEEGSKAPRPAKEERDQSLEAPKKTRMKRRKRVRVIDLDKEDAA